MNRKKLRVGWVLYYFNDEFYCLYPFSMSTCVHVFFHVHATHTFMHTCTHAHSHARMHARVASNSLELESQMGFDLPEGTWKIKL